MAINNISTAIRNARADALVDDVDAGPSAGTWKIYTAAFATLLATLTFSDPAFGAAAAGVATASAITDDSSAAATGTAAVFRVERSDGTDCWEGTVGTSGTDLNLNTASITSGDTVSITSATMTDQAS